MTGDRNILRGDVVVAGGGVAGCCAAIRSARDGAQTILIEKAACLGGTAVTAFHRYLCGLYLTQQDRPPQFLNNGLARELCSALQRHHPATRIEQLGKVHVLPFSYETLSRQLLSMVEAEPTLTVLLDASLSCVTLDNQTIARAELQTAEETILVEAKTWVDCSGDAVIAQSCNMIHEAVSPSMMPLSGFSVQFDGLQDTPSLLQIEVPYYMAQAVSKAAMPPFMRFTTFYPGPVSGQGFCKLSLPPSLDRADADRLAAESVRQMHAHLKTALPAFKDSRITSLSPHVTARSNACLNGKRTLCADDITGARKHIDSVAKAAWPMEFWSQDRGPQYTYPPPGDYYDIPYGCLEARGIPNLLAAGRCLSATPAAQSAIRVMGIAMATGEAAGREAAHRS